MKLFLWLFVVAALIVGGCKQKPPPSEPSRTPPRTDYTPEDFGIGRKHTKNNTCNREIDQLLEQVRLCYGSRPITECEVLQRGNSDKIGRLKNTSRCRH
ncbi:MAG TPA: hypothetical protein VJ437_13750 [Acidiferrobacterales bacterium]|nr:hypothetical protein [Acidiferrobacterales bacterium]